MNNARLRSWQTYAEPEAHKMNKRVLRDLDVAQSIQARTGWSGGGYQSEHATQERDPSPVLGEKKKARSPPESGRHRAAGCALGSAEVEGDTSESDLFKVILDQVFEIVEGP